MAAMDGRITTMHQFLLACSPRREEEREVGGVREAVAVDIRGTWITPVSKERRKISGRNEPVAVKVCWARRRALAILREHDVA